MRDEQCDRTAPQQFPANAAKNVFAQAGMVIEPSDQKIGLALADTFEKR
jgi:hypothetical protein